MATRFYYQANNAPTVSPPLDAGWGSTANMVRRLMSTAQNAATETVAGSVADLSTSLAVQLVSPPLAAQTITGTVSFMTRVRELDALDNINKRVRTVRVYSADGATLRGTFSAFAQTSSTSEFGTSFQGQILAQNNGVGTLAVQDGDIIVAEMGFGLSVAGDGSSQWETVLGGTGTDHAVSNGDTTGSVAWIEFSQTLVLAASTVTLTPATATLAAKSNTATPGVVTLGLTPATATLGTGSTVPTPGVVTVNLTPATATGSGVALTATPLTTGVVLTPAVATSSARTLTAAPGVVTTSIQPALMSSAAVVVQPQPLSVTAALTAAVVTGAARTLTATPGVVTVALTAATAATSARTVTLTVGVVTMTLAPAVLPITAIDVGLTPGVVTVALIPGVATLAAQQTTPAGVGVSSLTLTPAVTTATGLQVTAHPGLVLTALTVAVTTASGTTLGLTPGPLSMALTAATATLSGVSVSGVPGLATMSLVAATGAWSGTPLDPVPGALTISTGAAPGTWSALPVAPAPVQGVLLRPALATLAARKINPVGSVLPLNQYELPLARVLLDCLEQVLVGRTDDPPQHFSLRTGQEVPWDLSQNQDLCCEGLAYVKINRVYASTNFPGEDEDWFPCGPLGWAADLEMGVLRCAPVGDIETMPTDEEWVTSTDQVANDAAAMRLAIEDFTARISPLTDRAIQAWLPVGPAGACTGGTQIVTVGWIPC